MLTAEATETTCTLQGGLGAPDRPRRSRTRAGFGPYGLAGLYVENHELDVWCGTPDRDRKLPLLRHLLDARRVGDVLDNTETARLLRLDAHRGDSPERLTCDLVNYRVGKRCVIRIHARSASETRCVYAKLFRRAPGAERVGQLRALARRLETETNGWMRIPRVTDFLPSKRMLITAAAPREAVELGSATPDTATAARALACLHGLGPSPGVPLHTPADEIDTVSRWLGALPVVCRHDCTRLQEIVAGLRDRCATLSVADATLVHRDFYRAQLLRGPSGIWLTDLDTLATGAAELDVSTYMAHVVLDALRCGASADRARQCAEVFEQAYRSHGRPLDRTRMRFYLPCALGRLGALQLARGLAPELSDQLWAMAACFMSQHGVRATARRWETPTPMRQGMANA